jgi:hypothetical protein
MTDFLTAALPDIYRCMPDWSKVTGEGVDKTQVAQAEPAKP